MCACRCSSWLVPAGWPPGRVSVRLTFPSAVLSFFFVRPPPGWGCPFPVLLFAFLSFPLLPSFPLSRPSFLQLFVQPAPGCRGPWRSSLAPPPPPPPPPFFSLFFVRTPPCIGFSVVSGPGCPGPLRFVAARPPPSVSLFLCLGVFFSVAFPLFPGYRRSSLLLRLPRFLSPPPCAALQVVRALCAWAVPPPPPVAARVLLCLMFCCVVPWTVDGWFVWFVVVFGCRVVHCPAVFLVSSLAISRERCLCLFCWCRAVSCAVICCV